LEENLKNLDEWISRSSKENDVTFMDENFVPHHLSLELRSAVKDDERKSC
jgi:hypothetical protein